MAARQSDYGTDCSLRRFDQRRADVLRQVPQIHPFRGAIMAP